MTDPRDDDGRPDAPPDASPDQPDVGNVGEEAAKLLGALSEWARDSAGGELGAGLGQSLSGLAGHAAAAMADVNDHVATGAAECTYCPICRTVHAVRETSPEIRAHLVTAASSFLQAAAAMLATQVPKDDSGRGSSVERIDLDDEPGPGEQA